MIATENWAFRSEWLDWVNEVWKPDTGRVQLQSTKHPARMSFAQRATRAFENRGVPVLGIKTWVSVQLAEDGEGYADEYPHVHYPLNGQTLVHYLQAVDAPALDIFDGDEVIESVEPKRGLTVFMPNNLKHGVKKHHGAVPRVQLIATAKVA